MNDLETVSTDELMEELRRRHATCVFVGRPLGDDATVQSYWTPNRQDEVLGLLTVACARMTRALSRISSEQT
jgi:hypothetical protein